MNQTIASEDNAPFRVITRPLIRALRTAYIQGTTVVKLMKDHRAIQLYYKYRRKTYDIQWAMDPGYRKGLRLLVDMVIEPGDMVLDVGCGTGSATVVAAARGREVVGIDLSPHMIDLANKKVTKKGIGNTKLISTSVEDYCPLTPYDKVISSFMLPHITPELRPSIYACMYEFLKPGGTVALFGSRGEVCDVYETRDEAVNNLEETGFTNVEIHDVYDIYRIAVAQKPIEDESRSQ